MTILFPWLVTLLMGLSSEGISFLLNGPEVNVPKTSFFVMNETQRFMQLDYGMKPILVKRRPKEVLAAWVFKITSDRQLD